MAVSSSEAEPFWPDFLRALKCHGLTGGKLVFSDAQEGPKAAVTKLAALMDAAEDDALACMHFPASHRTKILSTNPIEQLNGEIKRRPDVARPRSLS